MDPRSTHRNSIPGIRKAAWHGIFASQGGQSYRGIQLSPRIVLGLTWMVPWLLVACPPSPEQRNALDLFRDKLPRTPAAIIKLADRTHQTTRALAPTAHAAAGLERAIKENPLDYELAWRTARVFVTIADGLADRDDRKRFAKEAKKYAKLAIKVNPDRPEGHYYAAASAGLVAESQLAPSRSFQEAIEQPALMLVEIAPHYEAGGGLRILGALYVKAPTWPVGVGDLEEGTALLERAVADYPGHPLNHLFLAEAYAKVNRREDAIARLRTVLRFPPIGEWALIGRKYRDQARQMLHDLSPAGISQHTSQPQRRDVRGSLARGPKSHAGGPQDPSGTILGVPPENAGRSAIVADGW